MGLSIRARNTWSEKANHVKSLTRSQTSSLGQGNLSQQQILYCVKGRSSRLWVNKEIWKKDGVGFLSTWTKLWKVVRLWQQRKKEDWAHPPVPTELITVGKARTGSVQQEPELGPLLQQADARYPSILLCTLQSATPGIRAMEEAAVWALGRFQKQSFFRRVSNKGDLSTCFYLTNELSNLFHPDTSSCPPFYTWLCFSYFSKK